MKDKIQLFEDKKIRSAWDDEIEELFFSVIDVIGVLSESSEPKRYWSDLKRKLKKEGSAETYEKIVRLKMPSADGKFRLTDAANLQQILRIVQSIPSPKAEPLKKWLAKVGTERIDEEIDPQKAIDRARATYKAKGYPDAWIKARIQGIQARNELTDEWKSHGVKDKEYALLTNIIHRGTFDISVKEHKELKGLKKENLRDNMTSVEAALTTLAEVTATEITRAKNPKNINENKSIAMESGGVAKRARLDIEKRTGRKVVSSSSAKDLIESAKRAEAITVDAKEISDKFKDK